MKILFDPLYTNSPDRCASSVKFKRLYETLRGDGVFFYWVIPDELNEEAEKFLPNGEDILYVPMLSDRDRYREYKRLYRDREMMIACYGSHSDWDVLVTNRTGLVPLYREIAHHHSSDKTFWAKKIVVLEDFPQMGYKGSGAIPNLPIQDAQTLLGYVGADLTLISSFWQKSRIVDCAKSYFSPFVVNQIRRTVVESTPIEVEDVLLKSKEFVLGQMEQDPFVVGFAGRLIVGHHFDKIFEVMEKNLIIRERKVRCVVSTQSTGKGAGLVIPDFVEELHLGREAFHDLMKTQVSIGVFFSEEEDYSMSMMEPIILGTPYAIYRAPHSEASLGKDYPFFFDSLLECMGIVKAFYDDYAKEYLKFCRWSKSSFAPLLKDRNKTSIQRMTLGVVDSWKSELEQFSKTGNLSNSIVLVLEKNLEDEPRSIPYLLKKTEVEDDLRHIVEKASEPHQYHIREAFTTDWHKIKMQLIARGKAEEGLEPLTFKRKTIQNREREDGQV